MFSLEAAHGSLILEYTMSMLPNLVSGVLNLSVFLVMNRSEKLQQSKYLRQSTFLHTSLGALMDFIFYAPVFFASQYLSTELTCRGSIFSTEMGVGIRQLSIVVAILSRYFNIVNPYNRLATFLQRDLGIMIWITNAVIYSPIFVAHGIKIINGRPVCSLVLQDWSGYFRYLGATFTCVALAIYVATLYRILTANLEQDVTNDEVQRMKWAARLVQRCLVISAIALLPLQVFTIVEYGFSELLHAGADSIEVLMMLISILEPVCFAMCDATFQQEYVIQTSL